MESKYPLPVVTAVIQKMVGNRDYYFLAKHGKCECNCRNEEKYEFPGGKVELTDTSLEEALMREIREELHCEVIVHKLLHAKLNHYSHISGVILYYLCSIRGKARVYPGTPHVWARPKELDKLNSLPGTKEVAEILEGLSY